MVAVRCNTDNDTQEEHGTFSFKGWYLIVAAVAVFAVLLCLSVALSRRGLNRRLKALRAAGYPTSLAELAAYTRLPEGAENAADIYIRAAAVYVPPVDEVNVPILGKTALPDRGVTLPGAMAQAVSDYLTANQQCLVLLNEAARIEHCRYDWDYAEVLSSWKTQDHREGLRNCALLLRLCTVYHSHMGDAGAAAMSIRDGLRLADSMRKEPGTSGHTVQIAHLAGTLHGLEWALNLTTFTDEQLTELDETLAASATSLDFREAMITQRCFAIERLRDMKYSKRPPLRVLIRCRETASWIPGIHEKGFPDILDHAKDCVEAAGLPAAQRLKRFREIRTELGRLSILHAMVRVWGPALMSMPRTIELEFRVRAHLDLARAALAIERYRLAVDNVPENLAELVPRYLDAVPLDPFDGRPIRYRRTQPGYLLYSIMEDGQDNGGRTRDEVKKGEPYDLCFIVTR